LQDRRNHFDSAEINGTITYINKKSLNGDLFSVSSNPDDEFCIGIFFYGQYAGEQFRRIANPGDSIVKHPLSDTLTLIKGSKQYYCHFLINARGSR